MMPPPFTEPPMLEHLPREKLVEIVRMLVDNLNTLRTVCLGYQSLYIQLAAVRGPDEEEP